MNKFLYHFKLGLALIFWVFALSCGGGSSDSSDDDGDTYPPRISSISPADDSTDVPLDSKIRVAFDQSMDLNTITNSSFVVKDQFEDTVNGSISYDDSTKTAVFTPAEDLLGKIIYSVELKTSIKGINGVQLDSGKTISFSTAKSTVDWVFMVYMAADNNLDSAAVADLEEMKNSSLNGDKVRFIVLCDREGGNNTHLYEPIGGKLKRLSSTELGLTATGNEELDTGSPATLEKFITFVKSNYGANHYGLVLWNHGGGWRDRGENNKSSFAHKFGHGLSGAKSYKNREHGFIVKDICWDENSGSYLGNDVLQGAVRNKGIDLLCMDACLMGMVETAYEMCKSKTGIGHIICARFQKCQNSK